MSIASTLSKDVLIIEFARFCNSNLRTKTWDCRHHGTLQSKSPIRMPGHRARKQRDQRKKRSLWVVLRVCSIQNYSEQSLKLEEGKVLVNQCVVGMGHASRAMHYFSSQGFEKEEERAKRQPQSGHFGPPEVAAGCNKLTRYLVSLFFDMD